jgi:SDR family mycofactocin-dependent oxidoreductase
MGRLEGRVALITGAARGQGRAAAVRLADEGADIVACDACSGFATIKYPPATQEDLDETAAAVEKTGRRCLALPVDVRDLDGLQSLVADGLRDLGRLDVVLANAGILNGGRLWEITPEQFREVLDVNVVGTWNTIKAAVPPMIEAERGGSIILTSSVSGLKGTVFNGAYVASKHAITGMTRTLANELGEYRIRVNSIHPAGVRTEMVNEPDLFGLIDRFSTTLAPTYMTSLPYAWMQPEDIANAVAFLASDESKFMTGTGITIDMGTVCR